MTLLPTSRPRIRRLPSQSGQAMVEAVVALSLLSFTWILVFYFSHISSAATKTAVAARHAAWSAGNGASVSAGSLRGDAFHGNMDVNLSQSTGQSGATGMLSPGNPILQVVFGLFPPIRKADVSATPRSGTMLRSMTTVNLPFMDSGPDLMTVSAHCEWDSVNKTWDDLDDIIDDLVN